MPWESFRGDIEAAVLTPETERKSTAGRKPIDAIVLVPNANLAVAVQLSDEQVEYQVRDRLSFTRFLTSGIEDCIPDGTTLWLFRKLAKAGDKSCRSLRPASRRDRTNRPRLKLTVVRFGPIADKRGCGWIVR